MKSKSYYLKSSLVLFALLAFFACEDDTELVLSTKRVPYSGSALRFDGYYGHQFTDLQGDDRLLIKILYKDGTMLYGGAPLLEDVADREEELENGDYYNIAYPEKTYWGVFVIDGSKITTDQWYIRDGGLLASYQDYGNILNDSAYLVGSTNREGLQNSVLEEEYHFYPLEQKPDSTNQFLD